MRSLEESAKIIPVAPGQTVEADLADAGVLRFERRAGAMAGEPVFSVEDGALELRYADGTTVCIRT